MRTITPAAQSRSLVVPAPARQAGIELQYSNQLMGDPEFNIVDGSDYGSMVLNGVTWEYRAWHITDGALKVRTGFGRERDCTIAPGKMFSGVDYLYQYEVVSKIVSSLSVPGALFRSWNEECAIGKHNVVVTADSGQTITVGPSIGVDPGTAFEYFRIFAQVAYIAVAGTGGEGIIVAAENRTIEVATPNRSLIAPVSSRAIFVPVSARTIFVPVSSRTINR